MNRCFFQRWEESERGWGIRPDGCSIHISSDSHNNYLKEIYSIRQSDLHVPYEYDRVVGGLIECFVSDSIYEIISEKKSLRLMEYELNNLVDLGEILFKT